MSDIDIASVDLKTHVIDYRDINCSIYGANKPLTCQITDENIESITKFMCYIMTKCPTNIDFLKILPVSILFIESIFCGNLNGNVFP